MKRNAIATVLALLTATTALHAQNARISISDQDYTRAVYAQVGGSITAYMSGTNWQGGWTDPWRLPITDGPTYQQWGYTVYTVYSFACVRPGTVWLTFYGWRPTQFMVNISQVIHTDSPTLPWRMAQPITPGPVPGGTMNQVNMSALSPLVKVVRLSPG